ncbi:MAG: CRISPR-associated endonuclease Cas9 [Planctomycetes bacterium]|nr:CRISPR-associated endonuclease Cas9 [Planctomycetota bacterium]
MDGSKSESAKAGGGRRLVLGLDIGTTSVGWALLSGTGDHADPDLDSIVAAGVRIFPEGLDAKGQSRAVARRDARLRRRQTLRRTRRIARVFAVLAELGWVPPPDGSHAPRGADRHDAIQRIDAQIHPAFAAADAQLPVEERHRRAQLMPYRLRAEALERRLSLLELARVMLHLAQRRGFKSNKRADRRERPDAKETKTKEEMKQLEAEVSRSGTTLGACLYRMNPQERRVRTLRTTRALYEREFDAIWSAQEPHHRREMTAATRKVVHRALFHQRPLRSAKHLIGRCELEPGRRRALLAYPVAQRFRLLQRVNDLTVSGRRLRPEERGKLLDELSRKGSITITRLRKMLGLTDDEDVNLGRAGEEKLVGDETGAVMRKVIGSAWDQLAPEMQERAVEAIVSGESEAATSSRLVAAGLEKSDADRLAASVDFSDRRAGLSRAAIRRLLPDMEAGVQYATAVKNSYPHRGAAGAAVDRIPILSERTAPGVVRNPSVRRTVGQVRRVVNAIIREHGKPDLIRIEMVRDLKRSGKQRDEAAKRMRAQQKRRDAAVARLRDECSMPTPSGRYVEMVLLAEECGFTCPYTGKAFGMRELIGGQVEIEHIIPLSLSLDDSFLNKTLCMADENRNVKRNRTPFQAYGSTPRWERILDAVREFKSDLRREKLRRFLLDGAELQDYLEQFRSRQLTDTAYAARVSADLIARLYGGVVDAEHKRRVQTLGGGVTAHVRRELRMPTILGAEDKIRDDFRHHTVDAVAVALTGPGIVKRLSDAAERSLAEGRRRFAEVAPPWPSFLHDATAVVRAVVPSYRADRRARGQLHEETYYGRRVDANGESRYVLRTRLDALTGPSVKDIVDASVRTVVAEQLAKLGESDPKKAFADPARLPRDPRSGNLIRAVRVAYKSSLMLVGSGPEERRVRAGSNHCMPVYGVVGSEGAVTAWESGPIVTKFAAVSGVRADLPAGRRHLFDLHNGDVLEWDGADGRRALVRVTSVSSGEIALWPLQLSTPTDRSKHPLRSFHRSQGTNPVALLRRRRAVPVWIDTLGAVRRAHRKDVPDAPHC